MMQDEWAVESFEGHLFVRVEIDLQGQKRLRSGSASALRQRR